jgi:hypothetical protein
MYSTGSSSSRGSQQKNTIRVLSVCWFHHRNWNPWRCSKGSGSKILGLHMFYPPLKGKHWLKLETERSGVRLPAHQPSTTGWANGGDRWGWRACPWPSHARVALGLLHPLHPCLGAHGSEKHAKSLLNLSFRHGYKSDSRAWLLNAVRLPSSRAPLPPPIVMV